MKSKFWKKIRNYFLLIFILLFGVLISKMASIFFSPHQDFFVKTVSIFLLNSHFKRNSLKQFDSNTSKKRFLCQIYFCSFNILSSFQNHIIWSTTIKLDLSKTHIFSQVINLHLRERQRWRASRGIFHIRYWTLDFSGCSELTIQLEAKTMVHEERRGYGPSNLKLKFK